MKVIFAYIPVVHTQVLAFLRNNEGVPIWLLDNEKGKEENVYLERDARALPAHEIKKELIAHGFTDVTVVDPADLTEASKKIETFIIPEDELVRFFLEKYAPNVAVEAQNIFIRWTQKLSTTEFEVPEGRTITEEVFAKTIITDLETEAQKSPDWWRQIASAVVKEGKVVAVAHNKHFPSTHALSINGDPRSNLDAGQGPGIYTSIHSEASVVAQCAKKGIATEGADIFVTTFPCPTCAWSLVEAGFARVYYKRGYSILDAENILSDAGIEIILVA
ncbi:MAG: dCMP deaminase [Patiriisocius sp.]|jgi:dCMP deaminase